MSTMTEQEFVAVSPFLAEQASQVLAHVTPNEDGSKEIGILVILAILGAVIQVYECIRNNPRALEQLHDVSFIDALKFRRIVKAKLGRDLYRRKGPEIINGFMSLAKGATSVSLATFLVEMEKPEVKWAVGNI
jgi:hypothetical protein